MPIIENKHLQVAIRNQGAELTSVFNKSTRTEHLFNADPKFWDWHAPVLFPVVGRCLNDEITINGNKYPMEKHGFARRSNFEVAKHADTEIVFSLAYNEDTLKLYPFKFQFSIAYKLDDNKLTTTYTVENKDDKPIYFSLGGHPAFTVPFVNGEAYQDYYLQFEHPETSSRQHIDGNGFFDGRVTPILQNSDKLPLQSQMFNDDAYIFKDLKSRKVTLRSSKNPHYLSVDFKGFNYLGIWAKVNAPYVCIEPWLGCADTAGKPTEYADKEGVMKLDVGRSFTAEISFEIG